MPSAPSDLTTLLGRLVRAEIEFILVGALAGVAQGAPLTTHDVDIVPRRMPANVNALLVCLTSMNAHSSSFPFPGSYPCPCPCPRSVPVGVARARPRTFSP